MNTAPTAITLDLNRIEELFQAPDADPFAPNEAAILGQSGMELLRKQFARNWPKRGAASQLLIRLPSGLQAAGQAGDQSTSLSIGPSLTAELTQTTRSAIRRYCDLRRHANRAARRLQMGVARRELLIALAVTTIAIVLLGLCMTSELGGFRGYALVIATLLAVYAASLSIWDALESLFFDWTPFAVDNLAYQWISSLEVQIVTAPAQPSC